MLPERWQRWGSMMSEATQINALLSQSNLVSAAEAAERRRREQEARELLRMRSQNTLSDGISLAVAKQAMDKTNGPFGGNGLANQMYNYLIDPNIPETDPRKIAAHEHLGKSSVQTLPDGTVVERQGIDTYSISGGARPKQETLGVKPPTGEQARTELVFEQLGSSAPDSVQPTYIEQLVMQLLPAPLQAPFLGDALQADLPKQNQFLASLLTITSGATVNEQEAARRRNEFFPVAGESDAAKLVKLQKVADLQRLAQEMGGGTGSFYSSPEIEALVNKYAPN